LLSTWAGGPGLDVDRGHGVRDAVVQVTRDAEALFGDAAAGLLFPGALQEDGAFPQPGEVAAAVAERVAAEDNGRLRQPVAPGEDGGQGERHEHRDRARDRHAAAGAPAQRGERDQTGDPHGPPG
jgi:hypothetical protein